MQFGIRIKHYYKWCRLWVIRLSTDDRHEWFKVIAKNKTIVLSNNRPALRRHGLKKRKPTWRLEEGKLDTVSGMEVITEAIMDHLEPPFKPG